MENTNYEYDENDRSYLMHYGISGMKWGIRRFQNADGSLTKAGARRYNNEVEKLKVEKAKLSAERKVLRTKKQTQAKLDKLEEDKKKVAEKRKAVKEETKQLDDKNNPLKQLKDKLDSKSKDKKPQETDAEKKEKLLKSNDADELYKNRHLLSTKELNERIERLNTETRLKQIADSTKVTGMDKVNNALSVFKKANEVIKTFNDSEIGKALKNKLSNNDSMNNKEVDWNELAKNVNKMTDEQVSRWQKRAEGTNKILGMVKDSGSDKSSSNNDKTGSTKGNKDKGNKDQGNKDQGNGSSVIKTSTPIRDKVNSMMDKVVRQDSAKRGSDWLKNTDFSADNEWYERYLRGEA